MGGKERVMAEYIDKDETLQYITFEVVGKEITCGELVRGIESISTIDIVHCRGCKYSEINLLDSNEEPQRWCKVGLAKAVNDNDYCSWGEHYAWGDVYPIGAIFTAWDGQKPAELFGGVWKEIGTNVYERIE